MVTVDYSDSFKREVAKKKDASVRERIEKLLRKIKAAKFVRENKGQVCPASWEPGKETLKPGLDLVGKI